MNDINALVDEIVIRGALQNVFQEYEKKVRIRFFIHTMAPFRGNVDIWPLDFWAYIKPYCPEETEIQIVFTNEAIPLHDEKDPHAEIGGIYDESGFVVIYNVEKRSKERDKGGNQLLETIIKQEIAHLFLGPGHTTDLKSFMYSPGRKSLGRWTPEIIRLLIENRFRKWN